MMNLLVTGISKISLILSIALFGVVSLFAMYYFWTTPSEPEWIRGDDGQILSDPQNALLAPGGSIEHMLE